MCSSHMKLSDATREMHIAMRRAEAWTGSHVSRSLWRGRAHGKQGRLDTREECIAGIGVYFNSHDHQRGRNRINPIKSSIMAFHPAAINSTTHQVIPICRLPSQPDIHTES